MGKQSKRTNRKKAQDRTKRIEKNLAAANALENPLSDAGIDESLLTVDIPLPPKQTKPTNPTSNSIKEEDKNPNIPAEQILAEKQRLQIQYFASPLPTDLHDACMKLFEENMGDMYRDSDWGLDLDEKANELRHENARFLIVTASAADSASSRDLIAFSHFRFETNDDDQPTEEVLYLYEIQVDAKACRLGLGKRLMTILEAIAAHSNMRKVMLTVFRNNCNAMNFYASKLDYVIDDSSPSKYGEIVDYEILSKGVSAKTG